MNWDLVLDIAVILGKSLLLLVCLLVFIAYILLADRKVWAAVQLRRGPDVVGPWGLFQSFADLIKFALKANNSVMDAHSEICKSIESIKFWRLAWLNSTSSTV